MRDIAQAHLSSITLDSLKNVNARFLSSSESLWFSDILKTLKEDQKELGVKIKTRILGSFALTLGRLINPEISHLMPFVDQPLLLDGEPFASAMGINPRDVRLSLKEMALQINNLN